MVSLATDVLTVTFVPCSSMGIYSLANDIPIQEWDVVALHTSFATMESLCKPKPIVLWG